MSRASTAKIQREANHRFLKVGLGDLPKHFCLKKTILKSKSLSNESRSGTQSAAPTPIKGDR